MLGNENEYKRMAAVEETHWWYKTLHDLIIHTIVELGFNKEAIIVDAGCGTGGLLDFLHKNGYKHLNGFDIEKTAVEIAHSRGLVVFEGDIRNINQFYADDSVDVIICNDVFYFLSDYDRKNVANLFFTALKSNGIILMNLPAFNMFHGAHDLAVGIKHRFTIKDIPRIFDARYFRCCRSLYWPFLLSPAIYVARLIQRMKLRIFHNIDIKSDIDLPPWPVNEYFYRLSTLENKLIARKPLGGSLFLCLK